MTIKPWKVLLCCVLALTFSFVATRTVSAAYCSKGGAGRGGCVGYFTGNSAASNTAGVGNLIPAGVHPGSGGEFKNRIDSLLNNGSEREQMGAAMIVTEMMGRGPFNTRSGGISTARSLLPAWKKLVDQYANSRRTGSYGVRWAVGRNVDRNSAYFPSINDDAYHTDSGGTPQVIEFYWNGGSSVFQIERACGNLLGALNTPPEQLDWDLNASINVSAANAYPGDTVTFTYKVKNTGPDPADYNWTVLGNASWTGAAYVHSDEGGTNNNALLDGQPRSVNAGSFAPDSRTWRYTVPNGRTSVDRYCQKLQVNQNFTGPGTAGDTVGPACVGVKSWTATATTQISKNSGAFGTADVAVAQPGDTIVWRHIIKNTGPDATNSRIEGVAQGQLLPTSNAPFMALGNNSADNATATKDRTAITVTAAMVGTKYCQKLKIDPYRSAGGSTTSNEVCFTVRAAPAAVCTVSANPIDLEMGDTTTISAKATVTNFYATPTATITVNGSSRTVTRTGDAASGNWTLTAAAYPFTMPNTPGTSRITTTYAPNNVAIAATCAPLDLRVSAKPIVKAYGGDVKTGWGPAGDVCTNSVAAITSWNTAGSYASAGTQFGAQAMGLITGFASAQTPYAATGNYPKVATGLSFANTVSVVGEVYGGKFNDSSGECIDYTPAVDSSSSREDYTTGNYQSPVGTYTVPNGTDKVIYVKGHNAYIRGNILYAGGAYTSLASIPSYKLVVVGGNIYIDPSVTQLSGMFVAQKSGGAGGTIYTCANSGGPITTTTVGYYNTCKNSLTVYGSFVAKQVKLQRTSYSKTSDPTLTAEQFIYGPEEWLGQAGGTTLGKPDAITSLPPTL